MSTAAANLASREPSVEIQQSLYKTSHPAIRVSTLHENDLTLDILQGSSAAFIGLAGEYNSGHLVRLALATPEKVLVVCFTPRGKSRQCSKRALLGELFLLNSKVTLIAFNLDRLALALHCDMDLKINNGVDILTLLGEKAIRTSMHAVASVLNAEGLDKRTVAKVFRDEKHQKEKPKQTDHMVLRAWSACHAARLEKWATAMNTVRKIDTSVLETKHLDFLSKVVRDSFCLEALKPAFTKNDISDELSFKDGMLGVIATRYKTRPRISGEQVLRVEMLSGKQSAVHTGRLLKVHGRSVSIATDKPVQRGSISGITTVGKEGPTSAESHRSKIVLGTLQGEIALFRNPVVLDVWFSNREANIRPPRPTDRSAWFRDGVSINLNESQIGALGSMLRPCGALDDVQVTMIHGPPGSGKTSVVAGFVQAIQKLSTVEYGEAVYLIAQSNVAVKNMAEKLAKSGFEHWKLIVSHDFHFDWHEHLYKNMDSKVIESRDLPFTYLQTERKFTSVRVILCTLNTLSSKQLRTLTRMFPPRTIIVDEASQIEVGDYLPVFHTFSRTLKRICFVGDDKQLAPFGHDDFPELQSIFEIQHIRRGALFLNTQYRMPKPIGDFISRAVYGGKLKTCHPIDSRASCRFVDVDNGQETKDGHSWRNPQEILIVTHLVRQAKKEDFRVITPYDAQRNELEKALKQAGLPWENRCFNVDSFQGNEADHIIISVVRTEKLGFLNNKRRTNVLLTRCKIKMTICSSRQFLQHKARTTLIGQMAAKMDSWVSRRDVLNRRA